MKQIIEQVHFKTAIMALIIISAGFFGCMEKPSLPERTVGGGGGVGFGADDTSFVRISPDWSIDNGYSWDHPGDIQIGRDGLLYVLDQQDGGRAVQMSRDGAILKDDLFNDALNDLDLNPSGNLPLGIGQDSKLNLFMVNGTPEVYVWNQYNEIGIVEEIVTTLDIRSSDSTTITLDLREKPLWLHLEELADAGITNIIPLGGTTNDTLSSYEQWTKPYVVYSDTSRSGTQFTDVDGGVDQTGRIYVSDRNTDRIMTLELRPVDILILENGEQGFTYEAFESYEVVSFGQGQGSTNNPTSIVSTGATGSETASMFFTQANGNFLVQRVLGTGEEWTFNLVAGSGGVPEVLELEYFGYPAAIAVGEGDERGLGLFYVADSLNNRVAAFQPNGFLFRDVASDEILIDLEPGELLQEVLDRDSLEFHSSMNWDLIDYRSVETHCVHLNPGDALAVALELDSLFYEDIFEPDVPVEFIADIDMDICFDFKSATTVKVRFPILNGPTGVGTHEGIVFIADLDSAGNGRVLRFQRSDSDAYIPDDGN